MSQKKSKGKFQFSKIGGLISSIADDLGMIVDKGDTVKEFISTGIYILNAALSGSLFGGVMDNRITCFAGESGVGKSFVAYGIAREAQKKDFNIIYIDTENAIEFEDLPNYGIDTSSERFLLLRSNIVEGIKMAMAQLLKEMVTAKRDGYELDKTMIILDSIGQLASRKEVEDAVDGKEKADMTRAKAIRSLFRIITQDLAYLKIPLIVIGQGYWTQEMFPQFKIGGGDGIRYSASTIMMLSKAQLKTGEEDELDTGKSGIVVTAKGDKNRLAKPKKVKFEIDFTKGCNPYKGLEYWFTPENFELLGIAKGKVEVDKATAEITFKPGGNRWYVRHLDKSFTTSQLHQKAIITDEVLGKLEPMIQEYFKYSSLTEMEENEKNSAIRGEDGDDFKEIDVDDMGLDELLD